VRFLKKNYQKSTLAFNGGRNLRNPSIMVIKCLSLQIPLKEGIGGERRPKDRVKIGFLYRLTQILTKVKSTDGIVRQVICNKKSMQESLDAKLSQNCKVFN
jgi:hypothetical protein